MDTQLRVSVRARSCYETGRVGRKLGGGGGQKHQKPDDHCSRKAEGFLGLSQLRLTSGTHMLIHLYAQILERLHNAQF